MTRVQCIECGRKDAIVRKVSEWERRGILYPECRIGRKKEWWNWRGSSAPHKGKSTAKWHVDRGSERYSKRGGWTERLKKNV